MSTRKQHPPCPQASSAPTTSVAWSAIPDRRNRLLGWPRHRSESLARGEPNVSVGRDGRLSGPELVQALIQGLLDCGCQVSDVGMVPTPVLYYAANVLAGKSGVMLTGSHNPPDYNGFKIVVAGETLANEQITALHTRIKENDLASGVGGVEQVEILDRYFKQIRDDIAMAKPMKVVVDCGNGVAGVIAPTDRSPGLHRHPAVLRRGRHLPQPPPGPGQARNLVDLIAKVKEERPTWAWPSTATATASAW